MSLIRQKNGEKQISHSFKDGSLTVKQEQILGICQCSDPRSYQRESCDPILKATELVVICHKLKLKKKKKKATITTNLINSSLLTAYLEEGHGNEYYLFHSLQLFYTKTMQ